MVYGYIRVSSKDQNEYRQLDELLSLGIDMNNIFIDKQSGKDFIRPGYSSLKKELLKKDDLLIVKSIDRLGRNYEEIINEWRDITKNIGADIKILDMPLLDTTISKDLLGTFISDIILQLLSFVAENERNAIRQRQAEGITAAIKRGVKFGRPKLVIPSDFGKLYNEWKIREKSINDIINYSGFSRSKFYRLIKLYERTHNIKN